MPIKQTVMLFFGLILSVSFSFSQKVSCKAATYVVKNIIKDFGAKGNGIADDHAAFEAAANFFNKRGGCGKLIIPYGLYKVGKQVVDTPKRFINGANVIYLDNVSNVSIEGVVNKQGQYPLIKYDNGLYYGAFYNDKEKFALPKCTPTTRNFDIKFAAQVGGAVYINNSTDVSIKNIELDGNLDNMILGGNWGDVGRQLFHVGIFMNEGRNIRLQNIHVHHFALDGLENIGANNLFFENVVTEYNGRQGFSWVDGDSLIAKNCKFNHTGRMSIHSSPAAGIDIEPERKHDISFARFTDCEIAYNYGVIAADEMRHAKAYKSFIAKIFEIDPSEMMLAFEDMMRKKIVMPAHFLRQQGEKIGTTFSHFSDAAQRLGVYTSLDYTNILESLIQEWNIANIGDLSGAAEKGRDYIMGLPERFRRIAERGMKAPIEYQFNWIY